VSDLEPIVPTDAHRSGSPYSPAVRAGEFVFVSGCVPLDFETGRLAGVEIRHQTRTVLENISRILAAAGTDRDRIAKTTVFLTDIADFQEMNEVYREFFGAHFPARSTVEVAALGRPEFRVEIEVVAFVGST
jgi:2-iminobutanoate/2-iminopropanoate deaminase